MTDNLSTSAIADLLSRTRRAFEEARSGQGGLSTPFSGQGSALDGLVRAVAVSPRKEFPRPHRKPWLSHG